MPARELLVVSLGCDAQALAPALAAAAWSLRVVADLASARKALLEKASPVGLLLVGAVPGGLAQDLDGLLESQQSTQWVGVFDVQSLQHDDCRKLIVQHLADFHIFAVDARSLIDSLEQALNRAASHIGDCGLRRDTSRTTEGQGAFKRAAAQAGMAIVGNSPAIVELRRQISKVAQVNAPVLIWGESGSGKELVAHAVHQHSQRSGKPFVALNCGALPASLIQSELFGHERGAFTGALREKRGLIESADGGTLFLDEVGDLALELQVNLLRFLQERSIVRVGASQPIPVDVRVIAASHMQLDEAVRAGRFREDLLYRLNVLPLAVPALRERKQDLELLSQHFFRLFGTDKKDRLSGFGRRAMQALHQHDWPGNVRELINRIRRAMVMSEGRLITPLDLGLPLLAECGAGEALEDARVRAEREAVQDSLNGHANNKTLAARDLGVSRMTLYRLMDKHGIRL